MVPRWDGPSPRWDGLTLEGSDSHACETAPVSAGSDIGFERRARLAAARLYLVCDSAPGGRELREVLRQAITGGVDIVQLRDKLLDDEELLDVAQKSAALCRELGALFIVNDRPAVAAEAGADGVHVGQDDMPVARVRELLGADMLIGLSTHAPAEIDAVGYGEAATNAPTRAPAAGDNPRGVDYIGVGPVYATPTKPGRAGTGLELIRHAAIHAQLPFFAIGGIHAGNLQDVVAAGARRVAVLRAIADAAEPECAARQLSDSLLDT